MTCAEEEYWQNSKRDS